MSDDDLYHGDFERDGEARVRNYLTLGQYLPKKASLAKEWLRRKDQERKDAAHAEQAATASRAASSAERAATAADRAATTAERAAAASDEQAKTAQKALTTARIAVALAIAAVMVSIVAYLERREPAPTGTTPSQTTIRK
jgi:hypothetical protein